MSTLIKISVLLVLLLTLDASDTSVPVSARVRNYTTDLFSLSPLEGPRWQCLVTAHMPSGASPRAWHQTARFCHPSFSVTDRNCKDCRIHTTNKNIAKPVWLLAFGPVTPVQNAEAQEGVNLRPSELQAQAKNLWGCHNNPNL